MFVLIPTFFDGFTNALKLASCQPIATRQAQTSIEKAATIFHPKHPCIVVQGLVGEGLP
jgi:hypothetical protein